MKKMSLLTLAAASFVGLVSCGNQPAPAPSAPTLKSVTIDVCRAALQLDHEPVENDDYFLYRPGEYAMYEKGLPVDPSSENPYLDLLTTIHGRVGGVSYLKEAIAPSWDAEDEMASSRYVTNDENSSFWVDIESFESSSDPGKGYWQISVYANPFTYGWSTGAELKEVLGLEDEFELLEPTFTEEGVSVAWQSITTKFGTGIDVKVLGENIAESYGAALTNEENQFVKEADPYSPTSGGDVYHDKDETIVVVLWGSEADSEDPTDYASSEVAILAYADYHKPVDPVPATFDEFVVAVANLWLAEPITSADDIYNASSGSYGFYFSGVQILDNSAAKTIKAWALDLPNYMFQYTEPADQQVSETCLAAQGLYVSNDYHFGVQLLCYTNHPSLGTSVFQVTFKDFSN